MAVIKKVRIPRDSLPPITFPPEATSVDISTVIQTINADDDPVFQYTTLSPHGLSTGDSVDISDVYAEDSGGTPVELFNLDNAIVTSITPTTFTVYAQSEDPGISGSGGSVTKIYGEYILRYRIISEDRNRISHWSPEYFVSPKPRNVSSGTNIKQFSTDNSTVFVVWDIPDNRNVESYDVYVAFGTGLAESVGIFEYQATISGSSFSMRIPTGLGITHAQVAIQLRTYPKKYWPGIVVAQTIIKPVV